MLLMDDKMQCVALYNLKVFQIKMNAVLGVGNVLTHKMLIWKFLLYYMKHNK